MKGTRGKRVTTETRRARRYTERKFPLEGFQAKAEFTEGFPAKAQRRRAKAAKNGLNWLVA